MLKITLLLIQVHIITDVKWNVWNEVKKT
jgi:hypothetical protein